MESPAQNGSQDFCLKNVTLVNLTQQQIKLSMGEVEAMKKICHPNIIKFYESCMEGRFINIIMEHAPYGDLSCMIEQARSRGCYLNEKSLWEYLIQISEGLEYLHRRKDIASRYQGSEHLLR